MSLYIADILTVRELFSCVLCCVYAGISVACQCCMQSLLPVSFLCGSPITEKWLDGDCRGGVGGGRGCEERREGEERMRGGRKEGSSQAICIQNLLPVSVLCFSLIT